MEEILRLILGLVLFVFMAVLMLMINLLFFTFIFWIIFALLPFSFDPVVIQGQSLGLHWVVGTVFALLYTLVGNKEKK